MTEDIDYGRQTDEHNTMMKILAFRLPHTFKKIGFIGAFILLIILLTTHFIGSYALLIKDVIRTVILFFLLMVSLSKEEVEDEYLTQIRFQSHLIAFVCAIGYSIIIPVVALIMNILITKITGDGSIEFYEVSSFEVIFILVCFQILFFETLKKFGRA